MSSRNRNACPDVRLPSTSSLIADDGRRLTRLTVQFDLNGEQCVILTNSDVLRHQLVEYEERGGQLPFRTTIRRDGCFKFT